MLVSRTADVSFFQFEVTMNVFQFFFKRKIIACGFLKFDSIFLKHKKLDCRHEILFDDIKHVPHSFVSVLDKFIHQRVINL